MNLQLFVDTNVFLSFYSFTSDELDEIRKLILLTRSKKIQLYITQQVIDECRRNRETKLLDALKRMSENFKLGSYPSFCKDFSAFKKLEATKSALQNLHKELITYSKEKILEKSLQADTVLNDLFESAQILEVSESILNKAKRRTVIGNPPGKDNSYGDAINWEIILANSVIFEDFHLVADDKDFYSKIDDKLINPFLADEYARFSAGNITCYRNLSSFFKLNYPNINLPVEEYKEHVISSITHSPNFRTTKEYFRKLAELENLSEIDVQRVLEACFENNQILWILSDSDIKEAVWNFYIKYESVVGEEIKERFQGKWKEYFTPPPILTDDDELPF